MTISKKQLLGIGIAIVLIVAIMSVKFLVGNMFAPFIIDFLSD